DADRHGAVGDRVAHHRAARLFAHAHHAWRPAVHRAARQRVHPHDLADGHRHDRVAGIRPVGDLHVHHRAVGVAVALVLDNITREVNRRTHLYPIDATFERGTFNVLVGRTRAGKTSLLRI